MGEQIMNQLDTCQELLVYFTGSTAIDKSACTFTATDIHVGLVVGDIVYITGTSGTTSDGTYTISAVDTDVITTEETPAGDDETAGSLVLNQEYQGAWIKIEQFATLAYTITTSGNATLYLDWSNDEGSNTIYTTSNSISGGTAEGTTQATLASWVRLRVRNNGATQTTMRTYLNGKRKS